MKRAAGLGALVRPPAVTITSTVVPAVPAGLVAVQLVAVQLTAVAVAVPNFTVVAPATKPLPLMVTTVPPDAGPLVGLMLVMAGAVAAVGAIDGIDRGNCRVRARERFGKDRMVDEYLRVYRKVIR